MLKRVILFLATFIGMYQSAWCISAVEKKSPNIKRSVDLIDKSDYTGARVLLERECKTAHQTGNTYAEANARVMLGQIYTITGMPDKGIENLTVALELCQQMADDSIAVRETQILAFNGLGLYYITARGNYYAGKEYFLRAMRLAQQANDIRLANATEINLLQSSLIQRDTTMFDQTRQLYERTADNPYQHYVAAIGLAQQYIFRGQENMAVPLIKEARVLSDKVMMGDKVRLPLTEADLFAERGDYATAHRMLEEALKTLQNGNEAAYYRGIILSRLANLCIRQKRYAEALTYAQKALDIAQSSPQKTNIPDILQQLTKAYEHTGDLKNALKYAREYEEYLQQSHNEYREYLVRDLDASYKLDLKEREAENAKRMYTRQLYLNLALGTVLILILIIGFILWRAFKQKNILYRRLASLYTSSAKNEKVIREKGLSACAEDTDNRIYRDLLKYISDNSDWSDTKLGREVVANAIGTNRTYLSRAVKECTGMSYAQFINHMRITRAIEILSDKTKQEYPLKTLSSDLGFGSLNAFYANFKGVTGMTPAVFRQQNNS